MITCGSLSKLVRFSWRSVRLATPTVSTFAVRIAFVWGKHKIVVVDTPTSLIFFLPTSPIYDFVVIVSPVIAFVS